MSLASAVLGAVRLVRRHQGNLYKLIFYIRVNGVAKALQRIRSDLRSFGGKADYATWVARYDTLSARNQGRLKARIAALPTPPVITLLLTGGAAPEADLRRSLEAARGQIYPHWQLLLSGSQAPNLQTLAGDDARIRVVPDGADPLALAEGTTVAWLEPGAALAPHALALIAAELSAHPEAVLVYADHDTRDANGRRRDPVFKPDWDPEMLRGCDYLGPLAVLRRDRLVASGGRHDLALRVSETCSAGQIRHLPFILLHRAPDAPAPEADCQAVAAHLERLGQAGEAGPGRGGTVRVTYPLPAPPPLVSLLVPTRDRLELLRPCLEGLLHGTDYPALEVLVLDNDSRAAETLAYFAEIQRDPRVRVLPLPGPFNFSALNNAGVAAARGEVIGFINNDIAVMEPGWLREMVSQALRPGIGAVGAKLRYGDDTIQHGGVILGIGGIADHAHRRFASDAPGHGGRLRLVQSFSAVTAACLVMRKTHFEAVGGFDAEHLAVAFNDVDLCLKLGARGLRLLWTPYAELYHLESVSRGGDLDADKRARFLAESLTMRRRWAAVLDADPCYNPNLTLHAGDFGLAFPPRTMCSPARWRERKGPSRRLGG